MMVQRKATQGPGILEVPMSFSADLMFEHLLELTVVWSFGSVREAEKARF